MSYPANGDLMFDRRSLDDVRVREPSADGVQKPSTDGSVASSTRPTREPQPFHQDFGDVHQSGTQ
jgi:hypothetical protein